MTSSKPVLVVGGGLTGLACATHLSEAGVEVRIVEATDRWGGSLRTDQVDGFVLDHDFFPLRIEAPTTQRLVDLPALQLQPPGEPIVMRCGGQWIEESSIPFDHSEAAEFRELYAPNHRTAWARPRDGVQAVASQLVQRLPEAARSLRCTVETLIPGGARTSDGQTLAHHHVVLAGGGAASRRLLNTAGREQKPDAAASPGELRTCWYFAAPEPPRPEVLTLLIAGPEGRLGREAEPAEQDGGEANGGAMRITQIHVSVPAPKQGRAKAETLVGVLASGHHAAPWALEGALRERLETWFGRDVEGWRRVRGFARKRTVGPASSRGPTGDEAYGITLCQRVGDDGIEDRLASGCRAAERVLDVLPDR